MRLATAENIVERLPLAQARRLKQYRDNLNKPKNPQYFDDDLEGFLLSVCKDPERVKRVIHVCDTLDWNQSKYTPELFQAQLRRFSSSPGNYMGWTANFKKAKASLIAELKNWHLTPIKYSDSQDMIDRLPRKDTHAGWSWIITGDKTKGEYVENLFQTYHLEEAKAIEEGSFNKLILLGVRTQCSPPFDSFDGTLTSKTIQEVEELKKSRVVSIIDIILIMAELKFSYNFQRKMSQTTWYSGGKDDPTHLHLIGRARERYQKWVSLDYSAFDQSIPQWLIYEAFDCVRAAFELSAEEEKLFRVVVNDFVHKVFVSGDSLVESHKGVPSGSMFTQIIDSIVNRLMIITFMNYAGIDDYRMFIMGDDNLVFYNCKEDIDLHQMSSYLLHNFSVVMNPRKVATGKSYYDDPVYLSRYWTRMGIFRHPNVLIAKMLYPERFRDYKKVKELHPCIIVSAYLDTFPLGMRQILDMDIFLDRSREVRDKLGTSVWVSGYTRFKQLYLRVG